MKRSWKIYVAGLLLMGAFICTFLWILNPSELTTSEIENNDSIQVDQFLSVVP